MKKPSPDDKFKKKIEGVSEFFHNFSELPGWEYFSGYCPYQAAKANIVKKCKNLENWEKEPGLSVLDMVC